MSKGVVGSVLGVVAAVLVVVGAGCGGSEATLTKAEYTRKANQICQEWFSDKEEVLAAAAKKLGSGKPSSAKQKQLVLSVLRPYEDATEKLKDLAPPKGEEKAVQAIVSAREEAVEKTKADPATALTSNSAFKEADEAAAKYGLRNCQA